MGLGEMTFASKTGDLSSVCIHKLKKKQLCKMDWGYSTEIECLLEVYSNYNGSDWEKKSSEDVIYKGSDRPWVWLREVGLKDTEEQWACRHCWHHTEPLPWSNSWGWNPYHPINLQVLLYLIHKTSPRSLNGIFIPSYVLLTRNLVKRAFPPRKIIKGEKRKVLIDPGISTSLINHFSLGTTGDKGAWSEVFFRDKRYLRAKIVLQIKKIDFYFNEKLLTT